MTTLVQELMRSIYKDFDKVYKLSLTDPNVLMALGKPYFQQLRRLDAEHDLAQVSRPHTHLARERGWGRSFSTTGSRIARFKRVFQNRLECFLRPCSHCVCGAHSAFQNGRSEQEQNGAPPFSLVHTACVALSACSEPVVCSSRLLGSSRFLCSTGVWPPFAHTPPASPCWFRSRGVPRIWRRT